MTEYSHFKLDNGLNVYVLPDNDVTIAVVNVLYDVGSKDEDADRTGFAHLFEHLMFGGSVNIPSYDEPLQHVGGENNAYTTPDYTNYYLTLPYMNLETGFWLESDRMLSLSFDPQVLEVQRKVVIEEFRQRYLNRPYGDVWHHMRKLSYLDHPYKWPVIGKDISHIEKATMEDVRGFFNTHYTPDRAILTVGGNVNERQVRDLAEKWFGPIPGGSKYRREYPMEKPQTERRFLRVEADVPQNLLVMSWHIGDRLSEDYYSTDLLSDLLGRGHSSRLYQTLVKESRLCTQISCGVSGSVDPGWLNIQANLSEGVSFEQVEDEIFGVINSVNDGKISDIEMEKIINQALATHHFSRVELLEKCAQLAFFAMLGKPQLLNEESGMITKVSKEDIVKASQKYLRQNSVSVLHYAKKN